MNRLGNEELFTNTAWQLAASWVLTGENASFRGVVPRKSLSLGEGTFGAFELAARYNQLDIDDDSVESPGCKCRPRPSTTEWSNWIIVSGGVLSRTVTVKLAEAVFPAASVAVQVTVEAPSGKEPPEAGEQATAGAGS